MTPDVNRRWIAHEFGKGIAAECALHAESTARAASPPAPDLAVVYHQIAEAEGRHLKVVEAIATRYGHTPGPVGGGLSGAFGRLREQVADASLTPMERVARDLAGKADAIHWTAAWAATFGAIGDAESARELAAVLAEDRTHAQALQKCLDRLILAGATAPEPPDPD